MRLRHLAIYLLLIVLPLSRSRLAAEALPAWTSIGPDGGNVQALALSPALPSWILAGVQQGYGLYKSADRGNGWRAATDVFGRNVQGLAIDAEGKVFYAATSRGLLKSTDRGVRWPALDPSADVYTHVAAHPRQAATVFAVRGGVLLRSTNGGVTRQTVAGPEGVTKIAFAPAGRRTVVYAGAGNGLWRSTDDGRTWTDVSPAVPSPLRVEAVAVHPGDPRVLFLGLQKGTRVLLKSVDGGATWRPSQRGLPAAADGTLPAVSELAVDRTNSSIVYAGAGGQLFRSTNGGRDWSRPVPQIPGGSVNALETAAYGVLAGTPAGVLLSTDRGLTWQFRSTGLAATSINGLAIHPREPSRLYAADVSSAIFKTANQGRPWLRLGDLASSPTSAPQLAVRPLALDPIDPNVVFAGAVNTIFKSTNGGRRWDVHSSFNFCIDVRRILVDPREPAHLFAFAGLLPPCLDPYLCTFYRTLDAGASWQCLSSPFDLVRAFPLAVDPFTSALYAQSFGLVRSLDNGDTWTSLGLSAASSFVASPLVPGTLWAGQAGAVARSRDGGGTWQFFSAGLPPGETLIGLAPDPSDSATLYAMTRQNGVFKSTDAGETWSQAGRWPSLVEPKGGQLLVDPENPAIVYAGTNGAGVLRLDQSVD